MIFAAANAEDSSLDDAEGEDDASIQKRKTMNDANPDNARELYYPIHHCCSIYFIFDDTMRRCVCMV